jgi:hypothetical protein
MNVLMIVIAVVALVLIISFFSMWTQSGGCVQTSNATRKLVREGIHFREQALQSKDLFYKHLNSLNSCAYLKAARCISNQKEIEKSCGCNIDNEIMKSENMTDSSTKLLNKKHKFIKKEPIYLHTKYIM